MAGVPQMYSGDYVMPFGMHKDETLDEIAATDEGLRYLDWAAGEFDYGTAGSAIRAYVAQDVIQREIAKVVK